MIDFSTVKRCRTEDLGGRKVKQRERSWGWLSKGNEKGRVNEGPDVGAE